MSSLKLGLVGLFIWIIPIIGFPLTVVGITLGIEEIYGKKNNAKIGLILNIIGLVLTLVNYGIGLYWAAWGE
jgi:Na+/H+-dicarboxylate symporter